MTLRTDDVRSALGTSVARELSRTVASAIRSGSRDIGRSIVAADFNAGARLDAHRKPRVACRTLIAFGPSVAYLTGARTIAHDPAHLDRVG